MTLQAHALFLSTRYGRHRMATDWSLLSQQSPHPESKWNTGQIALKQNCILFAAGTVHKRTKKPYLTELALAIVFDIGKQPEWETSVPATYYCSKWHLLINRAGRQDATEVNGGVLHSAPDNWVGFISLLDTPQIIGLWFVMTNKGFEELRRRVAMKGASPS